MSLLLFDENFSHKLVHALKAMDHPVVHVLDHVERGTIDEQVFALAQRLGARLVTKDAKIRRRRHEREAYRQAGIGVFIFTGSAQRTANEEASYLFQVIERLREIADHEHPGYVFEVTDRRAITRLE